MWTLSAFLVAALPHLISMPPLLGLLILALIVGRIVAMRRNWPSPPRWLRLTVAFSLVGLVLVSFGGMWGRRTAAALLCVMLAAKLMELEQVRDARLLASVCFFLIATQFLFDERLIFLAYLLIGCWLTTVALIRLQQSGDGTHTAAPQHGASIGSDLRAAGLILALSMPVALTLFLLFPRLAQPLWGLPDATLDGKTGLSETMSPGMIAGLYADDSPAFRVEFAGPPPPPAALYWRGPVLWNFDGTTWSRSFYSRTLAPAPVPVSDASLRYEVQLEPQERRWLLALDYPVSTNLGQAGINADYQLVSRYPITSLTSYTVISNPEFVDTPVLTQTQRAMALRLPSDRNPRATELARQLRAQFADDRALIDEILRRFRQEDYSYTLDAALLGRHGVDEFLFDLRAGYCEYYASAFAVLMRAAGIPSRIVTGYQGGYWNSGGQYLLVRNSDAHAWTEVWLPESGWTRVDPTAAVSPRRIERGSASLNDNARYLLDWDWALDLRNQLDRLQHLWNHWVLGFDARQQMRLLGKLGLPNMGPGQIAAIMLAALLVIGSGVAWLLLRDLPERRDRLEYAWRRAVRRVERRGLEKRAADTPLEFAERTSVALSSGGLDLLKLARLYHRARYGPADPHLTAKVLALANEFRPR